MTVSVEIKEHISKKKIFLLMCSFVSFVVVFYLGY